VIAPGPEPVSGWSGRRPRIAYLDRLKLLLVALIIAAHGALAYGTLEGAWPYQDVQEVQLGALADIALALLVIPGVMFAMGLFFLLAGLVTPAAIARKGPRRFARDRLLRLGLPLAGWTLIVWPGAIWLAHRAAGEQPTFLSQLRDADPPLDTGPMWFVAVLLVFSLAYAAGCAWVHSRPAGDRPRHPPLGARELRLLAVAIAGATVLVRLQFAAGSGQVGQLKLWQWPQFAGLFGAGILAAQRGGLSPVPGPLRTAAARAALIALTAALLVLALSAASGGDGDELFARTTHWPPLALAVLEGPLCVAASVWLLGAAQQHLARPLGPFTRPLARAAFAAFLLQGVVLLALMIALRPLALPAEVKALLVAALGVAGSFAAARVLVERTPAGRVL
jgi:hypothetical protein